jgi:hypothetical protein
MLLALASAVFLWSESLGTRDHTLLSLIGDFFFRRLIRLAGSRWRCSTPPPHGYNSVTAFTSLISTLHRPHGKNRLYCWWYHRLRESVFTEPFLRNGLHNPVVPPLLGLDDIENSLIYCCVCWTKFTELLPGNALIKSVTIPMHYTLNTLWMSVIKTTTNV